MDDYVAKPFRAIDLIEAVEAIARPDSPRMSGVMKAVVDEDSGVDIEGLRSELRDAGAEDALGAVLSVFVGDAPTRVSVIIDAIASHDMERDSRAAHAYKSSAGTIRALELASCCRSWRRPPRTAPICPRSSNCATGSWPRTTP